jgi:hypothetical protein
LMLGHFESLLRMPTNEKLNRKFSKTSNISFHNNFKKLFELLIMNSKI